MIPRAYCGKENIAWLTTEFILACMSPSQSHARQKFSEFVADGVMDGHREEFHCGIGGDSRLLGDDRFADQVFDEAERRSIRVVPVDELLNLVCARYGLATLQELSGRDRKASTARGLAARVAMDAGLCTLTELAGKMRRDVSTLSSAAERIRAREKRDRDFAELVTELSQQLAQLQA